MTKILGLALHDLRVSFADRSIWLQLAIIPGVLIFFIGLANGGFGSGQPRLRVDVFDNDGSALSAQFLDGLRAANSSLILCPMDNDGDDSCGLSGETLTSERSTTRLSDGDIQAVIEIPAGFGASALAGEQADLVYRSRDTLGQTSPVLQTMQSVLQRLNGAVVAARVGVGVFENSGGDFRFADEADRAAFEQAVYDRADALWRELPPTVTFSQGAQQQTNGFSQSVPGMASMYVMATLMAVTIVMISERKQGTLQRLMTMPLSPGQFVAGKVIARFVLGMIQYGILFAFGALVLGVRFGNSPLAILLVAVAFSLCSTALGMLLSTFVRTEMQAGVALNLLILTLAPLGGAWWPLEIVPQWMQVVGHISPIAWVMEGFRSVIFFGGGVPEVVTPVLVLLGITIVAGALAAWRFRVRAE